MKEFTLPSLFNDEPEEIVQSVKIEEKPVIKKAEKRIVSLTSLQKNFSDWLKSGPKKRRLLVICAGQDLEM